MGNKPLDGRSPALLPPLSGILAVVRSHQMGPKPLDGRSPTLLPPLSGILAVVRSHPMEPKPYTGMVPIVSGEVAEDLANYLVWGSVGMCGEQGRGSGYPRGPAIKASNNAPQGHFCGI